MHDLAAPTEPPWAYLLALGLLVAFTGGLKLLQVWARHRAERQQRNDQRAEHQVQARIPAPPPAGLLMGADGRLSTSKLQLVLWTGAIAFVFLSLLLQGRTNLPGLPEHYLLLLGIPAAGMIGAKALTVHGLVTGKVDKPDQLPPSDETLPAKGAARIAEAVSDDTGHLALPDAQFLLLNLVALGFFLVAFLTLAAPSEPDAPQELPEVPGALLALTGTATLAYLANKGAINHRPKITGVTLTTVEHRPAVEVRGVNFLGPSAAVDILQPASTAADDNANHHDDVHVPGEVADGAAHAAADNPPGGAADEAEDAAANGELPVIRARGKPTVLIQGRQADLLAEPLDYVLLAQLPADIAQRGVSVELQALSAGGLLSTNTWPIHIQPSAVPQPVVHPDGQAQVGAAGQMGGRVIGDGQPPQRGVRLKDLLGLVPWPR
jgi:hypothetical protein